MSILDGMVLAALICVWLLLLVNVTLTVSGYIYYCKCEKSKIPELKRFRRYL